MLMGFRRTRFLFLIFFLLIPLRTGDERASGIMDLISVDSLKQHVQSIHFDRNPSDHAEELEEAARYIYQELEKAGLKVWKEPFQWEGRWFNNIVAEKRGLTSPDHMLILGAHYDTVPGSPGADDNASAVAVLLEVAKQIRGVTLASSVRFIAFALEEYGYVGSTHHAKRARHQGEKIDGMISLEMVGFTGPEQKYPHYVNPKYFPNVGDFIGIVANGKSEALLEGVRRTFKTHIPKLPAEFIQVPGNGEGMEEVRLSDHSPFWDQGYPALMVTDTAFLRNPNYHLSMDTMETLDFEFMRKVAVGIYYSVVDLAK
jgi:Zn-dependent M28 family amino/carboxypeptidase